MPKAPKQSLPIQALATDVLLNLARAYKLWRKHLESRLAEEVQLTEPQAALIEALGRLGPQPLGEVSRNMLVTAGNIVGIVDRLERDGYVERVRGSGDRRVVTVSLTKKGMDAYQAVLSLGISEIEKATKDFSTEELEAFLRLLNKLALSLSAVSPNQNSGRKKTRK